MSLWNKKQSRLRRARRARMLIKSLGCLRLSVYRSNKHVYAQIISPENGQVLASSSTLDKDIKASCSCGSNVKAAALVGEQLAVRAKKVGVVKVAFDRSGYAYHGRVKALADAARASGLDF